MYEWSMKPAPPKTLVQGMAYEYHDDFSPLYKIIEKRGKIPWKDLEGRRLVLSVSLANYETPSHCILSIEGSPPRGTIIVDTEHYTPGLAFLIVQQDLHRIRGEDYRTVLWFVYKLFAQSSGQKPVFPQNEQTLK